MIRALILTAFLLISCTAKVAAPEEPVWGKQACAHCMMLLSDRQSAAQAQLRDGSHVHFDDVGCMMEWLAREESSVQKAWVRTPTGDGWLEAASARYSEHNVTPMDYGLLPAKEGLSYQAARSLIAQRSQQRRENMP